MSAEEIESEPDELDVDNIDTIEKFQMARERERSWV
jgi:hypothetical protein